MDMSGLPDMYTRCPYQTDHKCPCYNYYVTLPKLIALMPIREQPLGSLYMHA